MLLFIVEVDSWDEGLFVKVVFGDSGVDSFGEFFIEVGGRDVFVVGGDLIWGCFWGNVVIGLFDMVLDNGFFFSGMFFVVSLRELFKDWFWAWLIVEEWFE